MYLSAVSEFHLMSLGNFGSGQMHDGGIGGVKQVEGNKRSLRIPSHPVFIHHMTSNRGPHAEEVIALPLSENNPSK